MPKRKRSATAIKRRKAAKRQRYKRRRANMRMRLAVLPTRNIKKFRYVQDVALNPTVGAAANVTFSANGMYQPIITTGFTGNHQPYGFDQFMEQYNFFMVLGSKITVTWSLGQPGVSVNNNIICGVFLKDDLLINTNPQLLRENGHSRWITITDSRYPKRTIKKFSAKRFFNLTNVKDNAEYAGTSEANPLQSAYYHLWAASCAPNVDASVVLANVMIEYIAVLQEPNTFGLS